MSGRHLRVAFLALVLMFIAVQLPAPVRPDCNNQPYLNCGLTCMGYECVFVVGPNQEDHMYDYCYKVDDAGCLGGIRHPCCP